MNLFAEALTTLDYALLGLAGFAGLIMMIAFVFSIKMILTKPDPESWKNGAELSQKIHAAAGTGVTRAEGRWFFFWRLFPITSAGVQVMPIYAGRFKRYTYAMDALTWTSLGVARKKMGGKFFLLLFSEVIANLMIIGGLAWGLISYFSYTDTKGASEMMQAVAGLLIMVGGFALYIYPTFFLKKYMLPIIAATNITENDKRKLKSAINMIFFISIAALIIKILEIVIRIAQQVQENK